MRWLTLTTKTLLIFAVLCSMKVVHAKWHALPAGIPEIPDPSLQDIATVKLVKGKGLVIFYNPALCARAGHDLCLFSRYHEYGHIILRHSQRNMEKQQMEIEADLWAAQHAPVNSIYAAYRFFITGGGTSPKHGKGNERAARVARYLQPPQPALQRG